MVQTDTLAVAVMFVAVAILNKYVMQRRVKLLNRFFKALDDFEIRGSDGRWVGVLRKQPKQ